MKLIDKCVVTTALLLPLPLLAADLSGWWRPLSEINAGNTAWVMTSAVLVLLMTVPGLALFYGGMVRKKNVLGTMMHSFVVAALVSVLWMIIGYSLAFTPGNSFIGGLDRFMLGGMGLDKTREMTTIVNGDGTVPESVFMFFQMTFAIISTAIVTGAFAERLKFSALLLFSGLWVTCVYAPICHWVWGGGFMSDTHTPVLDFAGGTVVHVNAGVAGLVAALVIGKRLGYGKDVMAPHNMVLTLTGAAMLWVGWFGFNAGSAGAADASAGMAMAVTQIAAASAALTWMLCEKLAGHKPSALGMASGAVSGLVGITPAAGFVGPQAALVIGVLTAVAAYFAAVYLKRRFGYDDSLDAFGIHGFGGIVGSILTGLLFSNAIFGGEATIGSQLLAQIKDVAITIVYSLIMTYLILKIVAIVCRGLRIDHDSEREGMDVSIHGERIE
ncbi:MULTISPECIES: ammonium transporter [unclassified Snodgrassella]|uniref:ammonium transporter n=1 Tax=unclassified Snodgrassella TaxID=2625236 RepID=UPI0018DECBCC|nr:MULTISPECIES: ammonium transporter [unclassified Snodgrassella]MBI0068269.1 ammonium transporter [Snodgrassella sp. M0110]MBI0077089.1 ammonium transporter [Snodgrassella sp. M0118]MBI0079570.1 ammonium transporter [Snodgrassella sp. M0112]